MQRGVVLIAMTVMTVAACGHPYAYSIRLGAGVTSTTEGHVGGQVELSLGLNAHVAGRHSIAVVGRLGAAHATSTDASAAVSAEWVMLHARVMHRVGLDYGVAKTFDNDPRYQTGGVRGAFLVLLGRGAGSVEDDSFPGSIAPDLRGPDHSVEAVKSIGLEVGASVIARGDASDGRGIGYAGAVFQYDLIDR